MAQYRRNPPLDVAALPPTPRALLEQWLADAAAVPMQEPTAMTLATVGADGQPSARIVLFKGFQGDDELSFYTNYDSHKGQDLAANPRVALVFWWDRLERQVRVEGTVSKLSAELSRVYFYQRIRESQIGAVTSRQSQVVATREELDARFDANAERFAGSDVPYPDFWGGYAVRPERVEFWQGRHGRLHDRLRYRRDAEGWRIDRLEP